MIEWGIFGALLGFGVTTLLWQPIKAIAGGKAMQEFLRRITSREFLAFGFVATYAIIVTVGGYAVPEYVRNVIMPAIMLFGGFMAITGRNKNNSG